MDLDLARVIQGPIELTDFHVQSITYQILCGVKYIHSARVIHRDLKPGNILVNSQGVVKICDFGLARGISEDTESERIKITRYVATRWYRAPELIISSRNYSAASMYFVSFLYLVNSFSRHVVCWVHHLRAARP